MLAGDFLHNLQKLNKELRIFCGDDDKNSAGLWLHHNGDYIEICGVDKNYIDEHCKYNPSTGRIYHSGWRRVLKILLEKQLIDKKQAEKVFHTNLDSFIPMKLEKGIIQREIEAAKQAGAVESNRKVGRPVPGYYRWQDLIDIHRHKAQLKGTF